MRVEGGLYNEPQIQIQSSQPHYHWNLEAKNISRTKVNLVWC